MKNSGARIVNMTKTTLKHTKYIKQLEDKNLALTNENQELEAQLDKWIKMQNQGYTAVAINNDMIVHAVNVLPYSTFTYTQEIPEQMGTALYRRIPFYKLDSNGKMVIDLQKYNRYINI